MLRASSAASSLLGSPEWLPLGVVLTLASVAQSVAQPYVQLQGNLR